MTARRSVLFVHQNFPGQFPRIAEALLKRGDRVAAIGSHTARNMPGVDVRRWSNNRGTTTGILPSAVRAEADLIRAAAAARTAAQLAKDGFRPDVIVGNPGWGETLHLKEVWPDAKLILLGEYWYTSHGGDVGFDPEFTPANFGLENAIDLNARNMGHALAYTLADQIVCPTPFQASIYPPSLRARIQVHHEGIDVGLATRRARPRLRLPDGRVLDGSKPVVTFISRTLEPVRGYHSFMRALPQVMKLSQDAEVLIVGGDEGGYGVRPPAGRSWKEVFFEEVRERIDPSRLHFLGRIPHDHMMAALSLSWAHVYLTVPFTLSWSLLESMACGCAIVASDTAPVRDVITDGDQGVLVDFFSPHAIAFAILHALVAPDHMRAKREAAQQMVREQYNAARTGIAGWLEIIDRVV